MASLPPPPSPTVFVALCLVVFTLTAVTHSIPFVVFHGISDKCSNSGVTRFTKLLSNWSSSEGYCVEIGDGSWDSWIMPLLEQIKSMSELSDGYNIVGLSQGAMVGRGVLEFCDGAPPVKNFISLAGPHAGIAAIPFCSSAIICLIVDDLIKSEMYSEYVQDIAAYLEGCKFLPKLNNEKAGERNSTYKERFESLANLVLIMFEQDTVLVPKETSWFGYYQDGSLSTILPAQETLLYKEDWIGLKTLDEAGKVKFVNVSGTHLHISYSDMKKYIVPYLVDDQASSKASIRKSESSSVLNVFSQIFRPEDPLLLTVH